MQPSFPDAARRPFGIHRVRAGHKLYGVSTHTTAEFDIAILTRFQRAADPDDCPGQALVVAPLSGGFPWLMRDLLVGLLGLFPCVSVTEWPDASQIPLERGRFGLPENIMAAIAMIEHCGGDVHLLGVCQGAVIGLAATAVLSTMANGSEPRSLVLIGGPITPLTSPTRMVELLRSRPWEWFGTLMEKAPSGCMGEGRLIFPAALRLAAVSAYAWRHILCAGEVFNLLINDDGDDPVHFPFSRLFFSLMDLPGELVLDTIRHIYQRQDVFSGGITIGSRQVDLAAITQTALMTVEGDRDDIVAPGQTHSVHSLCSAMPAHKRRHLAVEGSGHFSLFYGSLLRAQVMPAISRFCWASLEPRQLQGPQTVGIEDRR